MLFRTGLLLRSADSSVCFSCECCIIAAQCILHYKVAVYAAVWISCQSHVTLGLQPCLHSGRLFGFLQQKETKKGKVTFEVQVEQQTIILCVCKRERESVNGPAVELSPRGVGMDLQTHTAAVQLHRASAEHTAHPHNQFTSTLPTAFTKYVLHIFKTLQN